MMDQGHLTTRLEDIKTLLSHLHGEVAVLEESYRQVLLVLRRVENRADRDDLTGLLRRDAFFQKWQSLLDECERVQEDFGVMLIDIDHFKRVNDELGHQKGDEVLQRVSEILQRFESPRACVGRYGGEEFILGVRGSHEEVRQLAEEVRVAVSEIEIDPSQKWNCTVSIGVASGDRREQVRNSVRAADEALYTAKRTGRNRVA